MPRLPLRPPYKPARGARLDVTHPLARGLAFFAPLNDGGGSCFDLAGRLTLPVVGGATYTPGREMGLLCNSTTGRAQIATPPALQLVAPLTIAIACRPTGTNPGTFLFGTSYTSTNTSPFVGIKLGQSGSNTYAFNVSNASAITAAGLVVGGDAVVVGTLVGALGTIYLNGVQGGTQSGLAPPTYAAGSQLAIGANTAFGFNPMALFYWAALWSRALAPAEIAIIGASVDAIWHLIDPGPLLSWSPMQSAAGGPLVRRTIYDHAGSRGVA